MAPFHQASRGCTFHPPMWNWGRTWRTTSNVVTSMIRSIEMLVQKVLACESNAPFGRPDVPEVYMRKRGSLSLTLTATSPPVPGSNRSRIGGGDDTSARASVAC